MPRIRVIRALPRGIRAIRAIRALPRAVPAGIVLALVAAPAAWADALTPESSPSRNAADIHTLYVLALIIGALIFVLVEGVLLTSIIRFRRRRGGAEPAQIRGNTPLEVGWTLGAIAILVVLATVTFAYLGDITTPEKSSGATQVAALHQPAVPGDHALKIGVNGQQYIWRFDYPGPQQVFSYHDMYVPAGTTVTLKITSSDVAHSWWIPKLGGKSDAIPGHTNDTWFRIDKPGTYYGECAELCGNHHADMRARVIVLPPAQFQAWMRRQARDILRSQRLLEISRRLRGQGP
ncbi:MAG: cytochrome c oxidase subunit II [Actinobacteria bacterium]|nr:cytochrome c oxidase subunit II [Actinomycetota bacterium]